jgi:hypothetical protein
MLPALSPPSRTRQLLRRTVALALFALQGAVALSPFAESAHAGRAQTHIEERGARHPYQHDGSTCVLCLVRSLHAAVPSRPWNGATGLGWQRAASFVALAAPVPDVEPTNLSRAPPVVD